MNLLHICTDYIYTKLYYELISRLEEKGITNTVYVPAIVNAKYEKRSEKESYPVTVSEIYTKFDRFLFKKKENKIYNDIVKKIDIKSMDKIHAHTLFTSGYIAYKIKKNYNIPYVVSVRSTDIAFFKKRKNLKRIGINILLEADRIVCISKAHRSELIEKYVSKKHKKSIEDKIVIINNGINKYWLDNINYKQEKPTEYLNLVQTGLMIKRKHLETSINVVKNLNQSGIITKLYAVGKGPLLEEYKQKYKSEDIIFTGQLSKEEIVELYKKMHIFILPSTGETFGLVYAEAMSQGLPVLYSQNEGFDNIFEDGEVGYRIYFKDTKQIAEKIKEIEENYTNISKSASEKALIFNWDIIVDKYKLLY